TVDVDTRRPRRGRVDGVDGVQVSAVITPLQGDVSRRQRLNGSSLSSCNGNDLPPAASARQQRFVVAEGGPGGQRHAVWRDRLGQTGRDLLQVASGLVVSGV